jgi:predicted amidohydrolase
MWFCGFSPKDLRSLALQTREIIAHWRDLSRRTSVVIVGSMPEIEGEQLFNTSHVVDGDGTVVGRYRKTHLFSPNGEHKRFSPGHRMVVCDTQLGRLGLLICYDLRFPELSRRLALDGAQVLCVSALWPSVRIRHWNLLLRSRALENQVFVVGCNGCGRDGELFYGGSSAIIDPMGECISMPIDGEGYVCAELDLEKALSFRRSIPCWADRRSDLYGDLRKAAVNDCHPNDDIHAGRSESKNC